MILVGNGFMVWIKIFFTVRLIVFFGFRRNFRFVLKNFVLLKYKLKKNVNEIEIKMKKIFY